MSEKNGKFMLSLRHLVLVLALIFLVTIVTLLSAKKTDNNKAQEPGTLTDEKVKEEIVDEEIKDGVYTNYTYGFRFEYPEIFNTYGPWSTKSKVKSFGVANQRFPSLSVYILDGNLYGDFYQKCSSASNGEIFANSEKSSSSAMKIKTFNDSCVTLSLPYSEGKTEYNGTYSFITPRKGIENEYVGVYLSGGSLDETRKLENEFNLVLKSFKFLDK